jgi:23S rRNA pseudouridine1911/1915/1917 synthase
MSDHRDITITADDVGKRLDSFLSERLPISRSRIQKLIKSGSITVDGAAVTPHVALKEGQQVAVPGDAVVDDAPTLGPNASIRLDIVHEDADVAVIAKPTELLMHPSPRRETDTLANALVAAYPGITTVGEDPMRPGIMHRLDRDASGLVVIAKTAKAFTSLKEQFKAHTVLKEYLVLVHGAPPEDSGTISLSIGRATGGTKMAARADSLPGDRPAVTHYRVEEYYADATLLRVRTETGRTHQIRAHFKAIGCPVAGDPLYTIRGMASLPPVKRLFLHAETLGFDHPTTGERMTFTRPLPPELATALAGLRKA